MQGEGLLAFAQVIALSVTWAVAAWCLTWWDVRLFAREAAAWARRMERTAHAAATALADRLGFGSGRAAPVTLGDVSEMIDVIRLGLSAGLSADAAIALYCEHRDSALSRRMDRARMSWQMGVSGREDELLAVARDMDVRALESFAVAVGQALALGAPLADTLARQGRECRAAHRAEVERQIERAPVKLLIPTGTLILPALLLSILGPLLAASGMI